MKQGPRKTPPPVHERDPHLAAGLDPASRRRAEAMARVNGRYLETRRDQMIEAEIQLLVESAAFASGVAHGNRQGICVIGATGAGKTTLVRRAISKRIDLTPLQKSTNLTKPIVSMKAPRPCTLRLVAEECLNELGFPIGSERLPEAQAWRTMRRQMATREVRFWHIDEAQHMVNLKDKEGMLRLSDSLKTVMDDEENPVGVILSGMPELEDFLLMHPQLRRRTQIVRLNELDGARHVDLLRWMVTTIVKDDARMKFSFDVDGEFLARLCHGADGAFGSVTQIVRGAVERVLVEDVEGEVVNRSHFAKAYALFSGCRPVENVMTVSAWQEVEPANAMLREEEAAFLAAKQVIAERGRSRQGKKGNGR